MRKLLYIVIVFAIGIIGCTDKTKTSHKRKIVIPADSLVVAYDDDMFSLLLPQGWTYETDTCETWDIRHVVDSLKITSKIVEFYPPDNSFKIRLVKGATRWLAPNNPVVDWAYLSQMRASEDSACVHISEVVDSLDIDGHDACDYWAVYNIDGEKIVHDQFIVIKNKYDLYYINCVFTYGDIKSPRLFHKILSTIKLK